MSDTFLPEIKQETAIVAKNTGRATPQFLRFFNVAFRGAIKMLLDGLTTTQSQQAMLIEQQAAQLLLIQEALSLAGLALETADGAGGGPNRSGVNNGVLAGITSSYQAVAQVDLLTVSAGNLTMAGTYYGYSGSPPPSVGSPEYYQYQVVEIDNGVDGAVVFTGGFTVTNTGGLGGVTVVDTSPTPIGSVVYPSTTTNSISYRLELKSTSTPSPTTQVEFEFFARRAV